MGRGDSRPATIMPNYDYKCKCGQVAEIEKSMDEAGRDERCPDCGQPMKRVWAMPRLSLNHWVPDYRQMDGEKEAIAAGMYE